MRRVYFLPLHYWMFIVVIATLLSALAANGFVHDSPWVGVGVWVAVVVTLHTAFIARAVPWIPGVIALIAMIQWVLAAWAGYHVPPPLYTLAMAVPASEYFGYAVPATVLFALGLYLPLWRIGRGLPGRATPVLPSDFVRTCDIMIAVGVTASLAQSGGIPFSLRYAVVLIEYLAFVGALGLTLARADGWGWRLGGVLLLRAILSTNDGTFQELLLWATYSFVLLAFVLRWRARTLVLITVVAVIVMGALDEIKLDYRVQLAENPDLSLDERLAALGHAFSNQIEEPLGPFSGRSLSRSVARANQGWIISRTMYWTPTREPYAHGETLLAALHSVLVPRIIDPNKYVAGGSYFTRFTGVSLRGTSMNLSPPGEMYANFGPKGGLIGVFVFALGLGLLYGMFARWAMDSILWWAWAPYVMLYTMQAETGIGEAVNHVARSLLVMVVVVWVVPAWTSLRRWQPLMRRLRELGRGRLVAYPAIRPPQP
jgi:hypothetical protein